MTESALLESFPPLDATRALGALTVRKIIDFESIVPLQPHGERPPLYLVHSLAGTLVESHELVSQLGTDRPVYGIQPAAVAPDRPTTVEAMAQRYLEALQHHALDRPVHLAGWGFGGAIACEMARALRASRRPVASLVLIDTWARPTTLPRPTALVRSALHFLRNLPTWLLAELHDHGLRWPIELGANLVSPRRRLGLRNLTGEHRQLVRSHLSAWRRYRPRPLEGRAILFRARTAPLAYGVTPDAGWRSVINPLEIRTLPGRHGALLRGEFVRPLAIQLRTLLSQNDRRS